MGSYTTLSIDNYAIHISKSNVDPWIMTIFTEQDKIIFKGKQHPENDEEIIFQYKVQIDKAIDRLTIMGFTLEKSEKDFNISKNNLINELRENLKCEIESIADINQKEFNLLEQSSFEDFTKALQKLRNKSIDINEYKNLDKFELSDLELYIADSLGWFFNYPASDWRYYLRVFFEYCPKDSFLIQDVTDITVEDDRNYENNIKDKSISSMDDYQVNIDISEIKSKANIKEKDMIKVKNKVFIVHGHDNETKQEIARFIEQIGLQTIILHEQASMSMTIIEKIEHYVNESNFAIILYTPCDKGRGALETKIQARNRARQNVVFEHGYLMAKIGRKNVCALVKGEIETPSDISGVVYTPLDSFGGWKNKLIMELEACGYEVNKE